MGTIGALVIEELLARAIRDAPNLEDLACRVGLAWSTWVIVTCFFTLSVLAIDILLSYGALVRSLFGFLRTLCVSLAFLSALCIAVVVGITYHPSFPSEAGSSMCSSFLTGTGA